MSLLNHYYFMLLRKGNTIRKKRKHQHIKIVQPCWHCSDRWTSPLCVRIREVLRLRAFVWWVCGARPARLCHPNPTPIIQTKWKKVLCPVGGWFYSLSDKVMSNWISWNDCSRNGQNPLSFSDEEQWGMTSFGDLLTCTRGCRGQADNTCVVGCVFNDGHVCDMDFIREPVFNFMLDTAAITPLSTSTAAPTMSTVHPQAPHWRPPIRK